MIETTAHKHKSNIKLDRGRISLVSRAVDCRAGSRGLNSGGWTITQGLKITEK